jgi:hypothetical protein
MADPISYGCDIKQGFEFKKTEQTFVGHMLAFKIGGNTDLAKDMTTIKKPVDATDVSIVGIITTFTWDAGASDPFTVNFAVSQANKETVETLLRTGLDNIDLEFDFVIYRYDQVAKTYFACFKKAGTDPLKGLIRKLGAGAYDIRVAEEAGFEVPSPLNFLMSVGIVPAPQQQDMQWAIKDTGNKVFKWGTTVGAKK